MIRLEHSTAILNGTIELPSSKSISNRLLILKALYKPDLDIHFLSEANDTKVLEKILNSDDDVLNVEDAGTVMRFLTAYFVAQGRSVTLRGTERMHERPISELVDALRSMGADITYLEKEAYPPIQIYSSKIRATTIDLSKVRSSQFISALLMIMPKFPELKLKVDSSMNSWMFVDLTIQLMRELGFKIELNDGMLVFKGGDISRSEFTVEADWTSFYYWYSAACVAKVSNLYFPRLSLRSIQGEAECYKWLAVSNMMLIQEKGGVKLIAEKADSLNTSTLNLKQYPDLAPSFALLYATLQKNISFEGLESLVYKESDRDDAIAQHLAMLACSWVRKDEQWLLICDKAERENDLHFNSFKDHRMVMSLLPLALDQQVTIMDPDVVVKSYPNFWNDCESLGFNISQISSLEKGSELS